MTLLCLECGAEMQEVEKNVYRCPRCGWEAEQLAISVDNFASRCVNIAINYDNAAMTMHQASHTEVNGCQPSGLIWMSPDCKHICKIEGVRPAGVREIDWVALKAEADRIKKELGELTYGRSREI